MNDKPNRHPRVVVVGTCASGKSTLVTALRDVGIDAYVCAQEHSEIPTLWNHLQPDFVVVLEVGLDTVRQRRGVLWPSAIYREQRRRLSAAREAADLALDTANTPVAQAVEQVRCALASRSPRQFGENVVRGD